jgi:hypothetical protein
MNTNLIMTISSLAMGVAGLGLTFLPKEIVSYFIGVENAGIAIILQILGALYFAFAMLNWTAKGNLIGGIYARPVAIGNLTHFIVAALAVVKAYISLGWFWLIPLGIVYSVFALLFAKIFITHPVTDKKT